MKLIKMEFDDCNECPHFDSGERYCDFEGRKFTNNEWADPWIPSWCPLPDTKEEKEEKP